MERSIRPKVMYAGRYGKWHDIRKRPYTSFEEARIAVVNLGKRFNCKTILHVGDVSIEITTTPEADEDMKIIDVKYLERIGDKYFVVEK